MANEEKRKPVKGSLFDMWVESRDERLRELARGPLGDAAIREADIRATLRESELEGADYVVYEALLLDMYEVDELEEVTGLSRQQIKAALKTLRRRGLLGEVE